MDMVLFDRFLFAFTIGSHILLVSTSIALAILISLLEFLRARSGDQWYGALIKKLVRPFVVSFGVGTASGIVMAVELVTLFPGFMTLVSETGVIAIFYVEIFAFFLETAFLVVYVYYGGLFKGRYARAWLSVPIALGSLASGVLIIMVNAWMNTPNGFDFTTYQSSGYQTVTGVNPWAPFWTTSLPYEEFHALSGVVFAGMMLLTGYFAVRYIRSRSTEERTLFLRGLRITVATSVVLLVLAIASGILEIEGLYAYQPLKYAALELNPYPGTGLPETIFGSLSGMTVVGGLQIPGLQGRLAGGATLPGLSQYPTSDWPPLLVHTLFDAMVLSAVVIGLFLVVFALLWVLGRRPFDRRASAYGLGLFALLTVTVMEMGWATDEIGRQPWIVYNVLPVSQAANYSSALLAPGLVIIAAYLVVVPVTFWFMHRVFNGTSLERDLSDAAPSKDINY